jgi:anaerobic selenocysteine-containing dehydrogenase
MTRAQSNRTDYAVCMLCEASCGIEVEHDGSHVFSVRGDDADPFSRGHICPKGVALADVQNDPDRLRHPLRRRGDRFEEVSWEEALDEAASKLHAIQARHGRDAVAMYTGNPTGHSYAAVLLTGHLADTLGTRNRYSATSVDALPLVLASTLMFGNQAVVPVPDLERTDFLLMLGANPAVSNGSAMCSPDVAGKLRALRNRGGRLVLIDPRRTETAALADAHHFIRPGADALLLAAMLHTIFAEGLDAPGRLLPLLDGWEELPGLVEPFAPERVAAAVGMEASEIKTLARDFANAPAAACYGRMGTCVQEFGGLASWLIYVLNIVTGNLDREGGSMFATAAADLPAVAKAIGQGGHFGKFRSRVSELPEFNDELPVASFAEEMETPGEGQIRALVTHAGNPVLSLPNGRRLERAFENLEFMVCVDIYQNETTRHADLILPPTFGLEREHYSLVQLGLAVRNSARYAPPILDRPAGLRDDWDILLDLATRIGRKRGGGERAKAGIMNAVLRAVRPKGLLRLMMRLGSQPISLGRLEREVHGVDLGPLTQRLPKLLGKGGRIRVAPELFANDLPRLERKLNEPVSAGPNGLVLIQRRALRCNNSWMHNVQRLVSGQARCVLLMHPDDAGHRGLSTGQRVVVKSRVGEVEVPLEITDNVMIGVVSLPHGWGHDTPGNGQSVATAHAGASVNDITDDGWIDAACGTSSLFGVPVNVTRLNA